MPGSCRTHIEGDLAEVELGQPAAAGYEWVVGPLPAGLEFAGRRTSSAEHCALPGESPREIFTFRILADGLHDVTLTLERPWENTAAQVVTVTLQRG